MVLQKPLMSFYHCMFIISSYEGSSYWILTPPASTLFHFNYVYINAISELRQVTLCGTQG